MKQSPGRLITIEGGEGAGKSTFCRQFAKELKKHGVPFIETREPGGTLIAQQIRELFLSPPAGETLLPETELFLIAAARAQHIRQCIRPNLEQGKWVLCDRFYDSTRAYQGVLGGLAEDFIETTIHHAVGATHPDVTFVLDVDAKVAAERVKQRAARQGAADLESNRFDAAHLDHYQRLREAFLDCARRYPDRMIILDGERSVEALVAEAWDYLVKRFAEARTYRS